MLDELIEKIEVLVAQLDRLGQTASIRHAGVAYTDSAARLRAILPQPITLERGKWRMRNGLAAWVVDFKRDEGLWLGCHQRADETLLAGSAWLPDGKWADDAAENALDIIAS
jgi:hypothetical protein